MTTNFKKNLSKRNQKCVEIATIMASTVYPRLVDLMNVLEMKEVQFEQMENFRLCCFTKNYKIQFYDVEETLSSNNKKDIFEINCKGKEICPYFLRGIREIEDFQSPLEEYLNFCKAAINALYLLENKTKEIDNVLEAARKISTPLTRNVLVEKKTKRHATQKK